jgi:rifampicin phosphotransferase
MVQAHSPYHWRYCSTQRYNGGLHSMSTTYGPEGFPSPDQIDGFWSFDKMHAPRPITPLSGELIIPALSWGFTTAQAEYDSPAIVLDKMVNYYYYASFRPHADEALVADRLTRYKQTLVDKAPTVGPRWESEWKPPLIEHVERNKRANWAALSDAEILTQLDWFVDHQRHQWYVHGHINFALLAAATFCDFYDDLIKPTDTTESYQCLQGFRTRTVDATNGLWKLGRSVRNNAALTNVFKTTPSAQLVEVLRTTADGRAFLAELDEFLFEFGWRSDAVYDMADITWRENPAIPLGALTGYVDLADGEDPEHHFTRSVARREQLLANCREKLADDSARLEEFNTLYEAARYNLPLTEDHAFWIDQSGIAVFRRFITEIGARLAHRGSITHIEDVHYLYADELRDAVTRGTSYKAATAERRIDMAEWAKVPAPPVLGNFPPPTDDPLMDAIGVRLLGITPPEENPDPKLVRGVAGSGGVITGRARVVWSLNEASDLDEGDIIVCEMTLPPWVPLFSIAGAFVTDTGGVLSHCAIVAREFGVPAVVGTKFGTLAIKTGQTVTVDGNAGTVTIHD